MMFSTVSNVTDVSRFSIPDCPRKPKGQSGMENPETSEIKFRENQRDNQEWRIQRHQK
jgi:hypothetical protein